jgi:NAD(P)-dependent dehydrogenase (short-subunit alcohol dehydrogenase family)
VATFAGKVAVVTGAASGIGRAVATELAAGGARVVIADVDGEGARAAAAAIPEATARSLDVTDAAAVERVVHETAAAAGRLDFLFNNAGIALFGEARDTTLEDWNRLIDVNLRGVVHGVAAAYPVMIRQGFGHIVNTASAAGLTPAPGAVGYAATKHAVVGLSTSLRAEAAAFGVRVSVACPGFIDTPIKHRTKLVSVDERAREAMLARPPFRLHPVEACARAIVRGVARNQAIIPFTALTRSGWWLYRLSPALMHLVARWSADANPVLGRRRPP